MAEDVEARQPTLALRRVRPSSRRQFEAARAALGHVLARRHAHRMPPPPPLPPSPFRLDVENVERAPLQKKICASTDTTPRNANAKRLEARLYPPSMLCPILFVVFKDPVIAEDGFSYERIAITRWLQSHCTSPVTGATMGGRLLPNHNLRTAIDELTKMHEDKL